MKINIENNAVVYVLCPANIKTGGTELAHQLVYLLNLYNVKSYITYIVEERNVEICEAFRTYVIEYKTLNEIIDNSINLMVIPEAWTFIEKKYNMIQKAIWWMSVDNYLKNSSVRFAFNKYGFTQAIKTLIKKITGKHIQLNEHELKRIKYHLVQSEYARLFLQKISIEGLWLSDYINEIYYSIKQSELVKEDIILYNPAKGAKITKKIMNAYCGSAKWIPLVNMSNQEMRSTLQKAKVYIDFGPFPGKDRIPREAALSYNCILTGTFGASGNQVDLPIEEKYKFSNPMHEIDAINKCINDCIQNYESNINNFEQLRMSILNEKAFFEAQVKELFCI